MRDSLKDLFQEVASLLFGVSDGIFGQRNGYTRIEVVFTKDTKDKSWIPLGLSKSADSPKVGRDSS
jgi:hypothetical protein